MGLLDKLKDNVLNDDELDNETNENPENIITLTDEDGESVEFELLDTIEYRGNEYVVLLPIEDDEVVILQVIGRFEDEEEYFGIEDEALIQTLYEIFKEKFKDEFDFI